VMKFAFHLLKPCQDEAGGPSISAPLLSMWLLLIAMPSACASTTAACDSACGVASVGMAIHTRKLGNVEMSFLRIAHFDRSLQIYPGFSTRIVNELSFYMHDPVQSRGSGRRSMVCVRISLAKLLHHRP
jgi:hypothetical protein